MSSQIAVNSIDGLKDLRAAMAVYGEDTLGALGAVLTEVRRTNRWLQADGPAYWQDQIKRRREKVASAQAELFRKKLAKNASMSEQVENLKRAEAHLQDAEKRLVMTRKWATQFQHAVLEYQGSVRRLKTMASGEIPAGMNLLSRLIDALEAYLQVSAPTTSSIPDPTAVPAAMESIATKMLDDEPPPREDSDEEEPAEDPAAELEGLA